MTTNNSGYFEIELMAGLAGMKVEIVGRWDHPRDQRMAVFTV